MLAVPTGSPVDGRLREVARSAAGAPGDVLDGETMVVFERSLARPTYDALQEGLAPLGDLAYESVQVAEAGVESCQRAMLQRAATDGTITR